ncbi:MAG: hypothetical protein QP763_00170 [Peptoniphilus duerdenii]|uniref:hypothetical protein n=1 Tax=Peptoniphilus duerdenii TaxID=507750 RepID=UPI00254B5A5E|nr:hypothetical protein [Peptoniphilus duerdenii]MDK8275469.1 hypothetical protein [Peptoniphilus duerdenii]
MGNQLDEMNPVTMDEGRNINVIAKQIPVTLTSTENMIPTIMYAVGLVFALIGLFTMVFGGEAGGGLVFIAIGAIICFIVYKKVKGCISILFRTRTKDQRLRIRNR